MRVIIIFQKLFHQNDHNRFISCSGNPDLKKKKSWLRTQPGEPGTDSPLNPSLEQPSSEPGVLVGEPSPSRQAGSAGVAGAPRQQTPTSLPGDQPLGQPHSIVTGGRGGAPSSAAGKLRF